MTARHEEGPESRGDAVRRRLAALHQRAAVFEASAHDRVAGVLEERARRLARPASPPPPPDTFDVVVVRLGREQYGVEALHVREVIRLTTFAALPGAEAPVFGVTTWRGELLPLLDVRDRLGLVSTALNDLRHVVVLGGSRAAVGMLVDGVLGMVSLRATDVRPMQRRSGASHDLVRGVTSDALVVLETSALTSALK